MTLTPTYTVIRDVSETLRKLVQGNVSELSDITRIVFDSPAEITAAATPKLSLFLYKVRYNKYLRTSPPVRTGHDSQQAAPLQLDLMYLFSAHSTNIETEMIIIEKILALFYDNPVLREPDLEGQLTDNGNDALRIVPDDLSVDEIEKLWTAFPNKAYRLAIPFIVSPVCIPSGRTSTVKPVIERQLGIAQT